MQIVVVGAMVLELSGAIVQVKSVPTQQKMIVRVAVVLANTIVLLVMEQLKEITISKSTICNFFH